MTKNKFFLKPTIIIGAILIGLTIGFNIPAEASGDACLGSCQTGPLGPGGSSIEYCDFAYPGGDCSGNTGGPCGGCGLVEL